MQSGHDVKTAHSSVGQTHVSTGDKPQTHTMLVKSVGGETHGKMIQINAVQVTRVCVCVCVCVFKGPK